MKKILCLTILSGLLWGCSTTQIPRSMPEQEISGIIYRKSDGTAGSYNIEKAGQKLYLEVGEYWSKITTQGILTDTNSAECEFIKTDSIINISVSEYLLNKY